MSTLLNVKNLSVVFPSRGKELTAVNNISFDLKKGERMGLVGESGAGKSVTGFSLINLVSNPGYISHGEILFKDKDIVKASPSELREIRGNQISMIFQDPMMTLNPVLTLGTQMSETLMAHKKIRRKEADKLSMEALEKVYIPSPEQRLKQYPHELSGGMRQRIVIAISILTKPDLIIADEPTTALDVTIQAEIMELLEELCEQNRMSLILITHDLGVVSQVTKSMAVMYAGRIIEKGPTKDIILNPLHPYTKGLISALPQSEQKGRRLNQIPGVMPSLSDIPLGCPFNPRCALAQEICLKEEPKLEAHSLSDERFVACHMV